MRVGKRSVVYTFGPSEPSTEANKIRRTRANEHSATTDLTDWEAVRSFYRIRGSLYLVRLKRGKQQGDTGLRGVGRKIGLIYEIP